jgi:hypothetical protein
VLGLRRSGVVARSVRMFPRHRKRTSRWSRGSAFSVKVKGSS